MTLYYYNVKILIVRRDIVEDKRKPFPIYIKDSLKDKLTKEAEEKGLSLNAYINMLLMERKK